MAEIRACVADDIPAVARLFQKTFRDPRAPVPPSLQSCLQELFFEHPWHDPELPSRVYVSPEGKVAGFIGVMPLHMFYRGRSVRAAVPSSVMVEDPEKHPLAGAKLVRAFLTGPQELSVSEPTSMLAQRMWERMGGQSVPSESMEWMRIFRPAALGLSILAGKVPAARFARPLFGLADRVATKIAGGAFGFEPQPQSYGHDADVGDDELFRVISEFAATYPLHPEWDAGTLKWQIGHAARNAKRGTLYRRIVYDRKGGPLGCYLYHARAEGIGWVLQVLAPPSGLDAVVDSLFAHAVATGCVALKGRTQARLMDPLLRRNAFFFRHHSSVAHSRDAELLAAIRAGDSLTSGLAAESWTRLNGDSFD
jgi:hypothetical protein